MINGSEWRNERRQTAPPLRAATGARGRRSNGIGMVRLAGRLAESDGFAIGRDRTSGRVPLLLLTRHILLPLEANAATACRHQRERLPAEVKVDADPSRSRRRDGAMADDSRETNTNGRLAD